MPRSFRKPKNKAAPPPPPPPLPGIEVFPLDDGTDIGLLRDKSKQKKGTNRKIKKSKKNAESQKDSLYGVCMMPKPEEEELEVKFTIRRSISGNSFPSPGKSPVHIPSSVSDQNSPISSPKSPAKSLKSPVSNIKSPVSSELSSPRLSLCSRTPETRRKIPLPPRAPVSYRRSRQSSCCSEDKSSSVEIRRHSPEGVEESPRRKSTTITTTTTTTTSTTAKEGDDGRPTDLPLRATVLRSSSIIMERPTTYKTQTAKITSGPTLTMTSPTRPQTSKKPPKTESPYQKPVLTSTSKSNPGPPVKPKSHYETPQIALQAISKKKSFSPYDEPDVNRLKAVLTKPKLTSPYQKPTVIVTDAPPHSSDTTPTGSVSPYQKPVPPTRSCTLKRSTLTTSFVRTANPSGLRSSFIGPPTPLKNKEEYNEKVETIYAIPSEDPIDLYSDDTLKAIKGISDKYDTSQRRQLQAMSFKDNTTERKSTDRVPSSGSDGTSYNDDEAVDVDVDGSKVGDWNNDLPDAPNLEELLDMAENDSPLVSADDLARIELFYASRDSHVCVCRCHAVVQTTTLTGNSAQWRTLHRGVPVWILTDGTHRRKRELRFVIAEPNTAFPVWMQQVSNPESYTLQEPDIHDIFSSEENQNFRVQYKDDRAAGRFLTYFRKLTSNRSDYIWNQNGKEPKVKLRKHIKVTTVGEPCAFNHVTKVKDIRNSRLLDSLSDMIMKTASYRGNPITRSLSNVLQRPASILRRHSNVSSSVYSSVSSSAKTINDSTSYVG